MPLDEDMIAATGMILAAEEVVETDLIQARCALVGRDVATDLKPFAVGLADHDRGVPADESADPSFDVFVTGEPWFGLRWNCVDVVAAAQCGQANLTRSRLLQHLEHHEASTIPALVLEQAVKRLQPVGSLIRIGIRKLAGQAFSRDCRMRSWRSHGKLLTSHPA